MGAGRPVCCCVLVPRLGCVFRVENLRPTCGQPAVNLRPTRGQPALDLPDFLRNTCEFRILRVGACGISDFAGLRVFCVFLSCFPAGVLRVDSGWAAGGPRVSRWSSAGFRRVISDSRMDR